MSSNNRKLSTIPLKLVGSRVWRTYSGGSQIDKWHGCLGDVNNHYPEEWVASIVEARNPKEHSRSGEGLCSVSNEGEEINLKELIESFPTSFLGENHYHKFDENTGLLIKILDSAERLTIQAHPTAKVAERLFSSKFGKTEAWYVLGGRSVEAESPHIYLGFKPGITEEIWRDHFTKQNIKEMLDCLHKISVKKGDAFLVEGGVPHAIGPGCFILEIQEPTDLTIRTERATPSGDVIPDELCHQGIGFEKMFEVFDYISFSKEEILSKYKLNDTIYTNSLDGSIKEIISYGTTDKFSLVSIDVINKIVVPAKQSFCVIIIIEGNGFLESELSTISCKQGDQFFIPADCKEVSLINKKQQDLKVVVCYPPLSVHS